MTFYENFSTLCAKNNVKPSRVAEACGINRSNVSNWKKNGYTPRAEDLKKIANYFHVPVGYLLQTEAECEYSSGYGLYPPEFFWDKINSDRERFLHCYIWGDPDCIEELENTWHISIEHPELVPDETFKQFVEGNVRLLGFDPEEGKWEIRPMESKKNTTPKTKNTPSISAEAMKLAQDYDGLDEHGQRVIRIVTDEELTRCVKEQQARAAVIQAKNQQEYPVEDAVTEVMFFIVPYQLHPMSAGTGQEADAEYTENLRLVKEPPYGTSYVSRVSGNSMEPTYYDGDLVFVHSTVEICPGQVGVFLMDGQQWIKELGDGVLISHNEAYEPRRITPDLRCQGRVLGVCDESYFEK